MILREKFWLLVLPLFLVFAVEAAHAQDTIKFETIKSIKDIPHATLKQKWMWIHRSVVYAFMKERVPTNDTNFYSSYKSRLVSLAFPISTRFINFKLRDGLSSNFLKFEPNNQYDIGISINTRFASFIVNTGVPVSNNKDATRGSTKYNDYQFNLFGKKSTIDLSLQTYKGFYVQNAGNYDSFRNNQLQQYEIRPDISVYAFSFNHYYLFNNKKFSFRSSFAFNERQKKSAGSFLAGSYVSLFGVNADSTLVSGYFTPYFDSTADIKTAAIFNVGLNLGYTYTLIIRKKFYATLSFVQGVGMSKTNAVKEDNSKHEDNFRFASKQNLKMAFGYNNEKFFLGTLGIFDFYNAGDKNRSNFSYSNGKFRVFAGYRFSIENQERKFLRRLNLIDYRL